MAIAESVVQRFWAKVLRTDDDACWLWTGKLTKKGYGRFSVEGRDVRAHRFAYELLIGPIPDGLTIDHVKARGCKHRHCVNPAHLEAVTNRENVLRGDGISAEHARKTHCDYGYELTLENTEINGDHRRCVTCRRERDAQRRPSRRAANPKLKSAKTSLDALRRHE